MRLNHGAVGLELCRFYTASMHAIVEQHGSTSNNSMMQSSQLIKPSNCITVQTVNTAYLNHSCGATYAKLEFSCVGLLGIHSDININRPVTEHSSCTVHDLMASANRFTKPKPDFPACLILARLPCDQFLGAQPAIPQ